MAFSQTGCPIRKSPDHRSLAPTRRLSQLITSFFASESQGIRRAPFDTFSQRSRIAAATAHTFSCILCPCCLLSSGRNRILSLRFTVLLVSICQRSSVSEELRVKSQESNTLGFSLFPFSLLPYLVENNGFEPLTPCLQSRCSSQLS